MCVIAGYMLRASKGGLADCTSVITAHRVCRRRRRQVHRKGSEGKFTWGHFRGNTGVMGFVNIRGE